MKKRLLSLLSAGALMATMAASAALPVGAADFLVGDINGDGVVNTTDARLALQFAVGKIELTEEAWMAGDVNQDDELNTTDARMILQYAVGKLTEFPYEEWVDIFAEDYTRNSFTPGAEESGSTFAALEDVPDGAVEVQPDTKQFGRFVFTTADNAGLPFNVACYVGENGISALLPAGVDLTALKPSFTYYGDSVAMNGAAVVSEETAIDFSSPVVLTMKAQDGSTQDITVTVEALNTGLPSIAVTTSDYSDIVEKENYLPMSFYVGGGDSEMCPYAMESAPLLVPGTVKGRGNSSWLHDKKSYTIKLDKKSEVLGIEKSKNWALVANYEDKTLLRNHVASYIAETVGLEYVMKTRLVDLWLNGEFWGSYTLIEKIEIENTRVNITDYSDAVEALGGGDVVPEPNQVGYLMEFDAHVMEKNAGSENVIVLDPERWESYGWSRVGKAAYYNPETDETFFAVGPKWLTIKKPSTKNLNGEMVDYIYDKVQEAYRFLEDRNYDQFSRCADVDSFVKWYLIEEFMNNTDSSMHSSVYMTLDVGGKLKLGPVWDFDRSSGNCNYWNTENSPSSLYSSGAGWFRNLFRMPEARTLLKQEWQAFVEKTGTLDDTIYAMGEMVAESQKLNFERWDVLTTPIGANFKDIWQTGYSDYLYDLMDYLMNRRIAMHQFILRI